MVFCCHKLFDMHYVWALAEVGVVFEHTRISAKLAEIRVRLHTLSLVKFAHLITKDTVFTKLFFKISKIPKCYLI